MQLIAIEKLCRAQGVLVGKLVLIVATVCCFASPARADECPASAEQALFNAYLGAQNGEVSAQQLFGLANQALTLCTDRPVALGQAALIFGGIAAVVQGPENKFVAYSKAYEATLKSWSVTGYTETPIIQKPDGKPMRLHVAGDVLKNHGPVVAGLADLSEKGQIHAIFGPGAQAEFLCGEQLSSLYEKEIKKLANWAHVKKSRLLLIRPRLSAIYAQCSVYSEKLNSPLARVNDDLSGFYAREKAFANAAQAARKALEFVDAFLSSDERPRDWNHARRLKLYSRFQDYQSKAVPSE